MKNHSGQTYITDRLYAFTDGVYAIVITLLVLDLHVPEIPGLDEAALLADLQEQTPNFIAYLISFFAVGFGWIRHHWTLKHIEKCDIKTFWLNMLHLLFVTLIPYTASLVGHYEQDTIAVILFSGSLGLVALTLIILHQYLVAKTEWHGKDAPEEWLTPNWLMLYPSLPFSLGSILISFINVYAALALWILLPFWVFFFHINAR